MNDKKGIVVLVEGASDGAAFNSVMEEYFSSEEVYFIFTSGDITSRYDVTRSNVITKIEKAVNEARKKYCYDWKDIVRIIHIVDTDGTFTNNCVVKADVENIQYFEDHMESKNVQETEKRNKSKAEIMTKLYSTGKIHNTEYRIYFNSCNLEHVLYNELKDFSNEQKTEMSDDFDEKYEGHLSEFIEFISNPEIAVPGSYKETWKFIETGKNSLQRHTNVHLIFAK